MIFVKLAVFFEAEYRTMICWYRNLKNIGCIMNPVFDFNVGQSVGIISGVMHPQISHCARACVACGVVNGTPALYLGGHWLQLQLNELL